MNFWQFLDRNMDYVVYIVLIIAMFGAIIFAGGK
jgi:hypothetical protein